MKKSNYSEPFDFEIEEAIDTSDAQDESGDDDVGVPFNPAQINITPKQDSLRNLIERLKNDEIDMNTDFQRNADLWGGRQMSRLIESIMIRFPLPAFYFDASDDDKWLIVDGLQRLSSIKNLLWTGS